MLKGRAPLYDALLQRQQGVRALSRQASPAGAQRVPQAVVGNPHPGAQPGSRADLGQVGSRHQFPFPMPRSHVALRFTLLSPPWMAHQAWAGSSAWPSGWPRVLAVVGLQDEETGTSPLNARRQASQALNWGMVPQHQGLNPTAQRQARGWQGGSGKWQTGLQLRLWAQQVSLTVPGAPLRTNPQALAQRALQKAREHRIMER